jgi:putative SOS response-associated peptidase YedK
MCGRFVLATKPSAFIDRFRIAEQNKNSDQQLEFSERELELETSQRIDHVYEHFNIAPRGRVYAISRHETQTIELSKFRWG